MLARWTPLLPCARRIIPPFPFPLDASSNPSEENETLTTCVVWPSSVRSKRPVATSQISAVPAELPMTRLRPELSKAIDQHKCLADPSIRMVRPDLRSLRCTGPPIPPLAKIVPVGSIATAKMPSPSALSRRNRFPVADSHTLTVSSPPPETIIVPVGSNTTDLTELLLVVRVLSSTPLWTSQTRTVRSIPPLASIRLVGSKDTLHTIPSWPSNVRRTLPFLASHMMTFPFSEPAASTRPFGDQEIFPVKAPPPNVRASLMPLGSANLRIPIFRPSALCFFFVMVGINSVGLRLASINRY